MKAVMVLNIRLNRKLTSQKYLIFIPFILIICISFYYFYKTIAYKNTGSSKLREIGKIVDATILMILLMSI